MEKGKDTKETLEGYLKELHLPAFRASYEEMAQQAQQEGLSFEQYLLGLAQRECQQRWNRRIERLLDDSGLLLEKSWPACSTRAGRWMPTPWPRGCVNTTRPGRRPTCRCRRWTCPCMTPC